MLLLPAGVNLSAQPVPHHFTGMTVLPDQTAMLSLDGSVSNMFNLMGTNFYSEDQWLFSKATNDAVLLLVRNANHFTQSTGAWVWQVPWGRGPALAYDACLVWFFDTYLKGEPPPFPTNPEIYNVQRK